MQHRIITVLLAKAIIISSLSACTVNLTDQTASTLYYNTPANIQNFSADVTKTGNVSIAGVTINTDSGGSAAMTGSGVGLWQGAVPIPPCEELAAYNFQVSFQKGSSSTISTKIFPETGKFVRPIASTNSMCSGIINASKTFQVNITEDLADINPGDGICRTNMVEGTANCSLRAAIMEANAHPGIDLILVPNNRYRLTRTKPSGVELDNAPEDSWGDLDITDSVAIEGTASNSAHIGWLMQTQTSSFEPNGYLVPVMDTIDRTTGATNFAKIDGNSIDRVFQIHPMSGDDSFVAFKKLAILNGYKNDQMGGGLLNGGNLRLEKVAIYDNKLQQGSGAGGVFSDNRGAGIANTGTLYATEIAIVNNRILETTGFAGGLWANRGSKTNISNSLIALNQSRFAPAIYIDAPEGQPSLGGQMQLTNVTITQHLATGSVRYAVNNNGNLSLSYVSLVSNFNASGGLSSHSSASTRIHNSLLVDNGTGSAADCSGPATVTGWTAIKSASANCSSTASTSQINFPSSSSYLLGSLTYEGGFTYLVRIIPSSSATALPIIDAVEGDFSAPATDQRGASYNRNIDGNGDGTAQRDIGAFEYIPL